MMPCSQVLCLLITGVHQFKDCNKTAEEALVRDKIPEATMPRGRRGKGRNPSGPALIKGRAKGQVKTMIHKTTDNARLGKPMFIDIMPAVKIHPKNTFTLRMSV